MSHSHRPWIVALCVAALIGCADEDDDDARITAPDLPTGPGRTFPVETVSFSTIDDVAVNGVFGRIDGGSRVPAVILVHDIGGGSSGAEWLFSGFFQELLENDMQPLAIDLRGHGSTALPNDGRPAAVLTLEDLDVLHLEVQAALAWLRTRASVDISRVAVVGNGGGGNVAYVSVGAFPEELQAGIALSPGLWDIELQPLIIGAGLAPFAPHSMLYVVGEDDFLPGPDNQPLSYAGFASALNTLTEEPKSLTVFESSQAHGLSLLQSEVAVDLILTWLKTHL